MAADELNFSFAVGSRNRSSSVLYPESEKSVRITSNPFRVGNEEGQSIKCKAHLEESDIFSESSSDQSYRNDNFSFESSSDEEYRKGNSSEGSVELDAISRLRKKAQRKKYRSGNNRMQFRASAGITRQRYPLLLNETLQKSAVEGQAPPVPARRNMSNSRPPLILSHVKSEDQSRANSSCGSDVECLYGVVMKDKKKNKAAARQSSAESEEPSSSSKFGPPTSAIVSEDSDKKEEEDEKSPT